MSDRFECFIVPTRDFSIKYLSEALDEFIHDVESGFIPDKEETDSLQIVFGGVGDEIMDDLQLFQENKAVPEVEMWLMRYSKRLNSIPHGSDDLTSTVNLIIESIETGFFSEFLERLSGEQQMTVKMSEDG